MLGCALCFCRGMRTESFQLELSCETMVAGRCKLWTSLADECSNALLSIDCISRLPASCFSCIPATGWLRCSFHQPDCEILAIPVASAPATRVPRQSRQPPYRRCVSANFPNCSQTTLPLPRPDGRVTCGRPIDRPLSRCRWSEQGAGISCSV